ncbi:MAG TPA: hypothetical protein VGQ34_09685 [Sphingomicrobium sp.]|jgi:hypothetical protein|nr:hypothetical protein [Sphingomicrobium sp.]
MILGQRVRGRRLALLFAALAIATSAAASDDSQIWSGGHHEAVGQIALYPNS